MCTDSARKKSRSEGATVNYTDFVPLYANQSKSNRPQQHVCCKILYTYVCCPGCTSSCVCRASRIFLMLSRMPWVSHTLLCTLSRGCGQPTVIFYYLLCIGVWRFIPLSPESIDKLPFLIEGATNILLLHVPLVLSVSKFNFQQLLSLFDFFHLYLRALRPRTLAFIR